MDQTFNLDDTPPGGSPPMMDLGRAGRFDFGAMQSMFQPRAAGGSPQMEDLGRAGRFDFGALQPRTVNPGTQTLGGARTRFDVGDSLNMRTHLVGTPPSYSQQTRMDSTLSPGGSTRMADNPLNITHRAAFPPSSYETPARSRITRYGHTQKKQHPIHPGLHNSPPEEGDPRFPAPVKRVILTSPYREEPLLVDINVDPKPLIQTESGEHFVCDVAVNLREPRRRYRSIATYGVPPAVIPTTRRRGGIGTPRGIFRKDHLNIRRVLGPDYQSPEDYSYPGPRSPTRALPPPPFDLSDRSISWEKLPGLDTTYDASAMNRTYDASSPQPPLDRTYDASSPQPPFDRTFDASSPPPLGGTFRASPVSLDRTRPISPRPPLDRTFDASSPPPLDGTFRASPDSLASTIPLSPRSRSSGTFDVSSSLPLDGTFDRMSSPGLGGTSDQLPEFEGSYYRFPSPSPDGTFDQSPQFQGSYYRYPSPSPGGTFDQSPESQGSYSGFPGLSYDGTFERSLSSPTPLGAYAMTSSPKQGYPRRLDESLSVSPITHGRRSPRVEARIDFDQRQNLEHWLPRLADGRIDMSQLQRMGDEIERNRSQNFEGSFPRLDGTFDRGASRRLDFTSNLGSYDLSRPQRLDGTFERSPSPNLGGTFDLGRAQRLDGTFGRSPSPNFDLGRAQRLDGTFQRSPSPNLGGTFDLGRAQRLDGTFERTPSQNFDLGRAQRLDEVMRQGAPGRFDGSYDLGRRQRFDDMMGRGAPAGLGGSFEYRAQPLFDDASGSSEGSVYRIIPYDGSFEGSFDQSGFLSATMESGLGDSMDTTSGRSRSPGPDMSFVSGSESGMGSSLEESYRSFDGRVSPRLHRTF